MAILIRDRVKFERFKEVFDKEGRYVVVKGKMEGKIVTLINVYALPDSERQLFEDLFDIIVLEMDGIVIYGGSLM